MRVVETFPEPVRVIENAWIPMRDGVRLAARVWMPEDAEQNPVPAILEYMPYRKRDFTRLRDEPLHHYFAGHGYIGVRLDVRGTGDSEGLLRDEYLAQEQDDAIDAIEWLTQQPWCDGKVGMIGLSWAGFNSLQVAARRPAALKAIITMCSTDDRYADDAHYKGGCLLNENLTWGSAFFLLNAYPPDPEIAGESWRERWLDRIRNNRLFPKLWMQHPHRDSYWKHGSVCEDYGAIECAVYAVGGWADGYVNAVARLLAGLRAPCKALIGPWPHAFPHAAVPGPRIGFFQEAVRWWDYWLKGRDNGIMDEPPFRAWMEHWTEPAPYVEDKPGHWVAEESWPSPRIHWQRWYLNVLSLGDTPDPEDAMRVRSPQTTGLKGGDFYGFGTAGDAPLDQREDDGRSLVFDSDPLAKALDILGAPAVELELAADRPVAYVVVRLNDVAPDGASGRVSYGVLNLTHRDSHEFPQPLVPGNRYRVTVRLNDIAYRFRSGHTLRVAISTCYWPMLWPPPEPVELTVYTSVSELHLPIRPSRSEDRELPDFEPPERGPRPDTTPLEWAPSHRLVELDLTTDETVYTTFSDGGDFGGAAVARLDDIDLTIGYTIRRVFRINEQNPHSAHAQIEQQTLMKRGDWSVRMECHTDLTADASSFHIKATLDAYEGEALIASRHWDERLPRNLL
ncbi:MAG: CocE/NonD family hydrolase [Marinobacter sp.]|uniref:CocE/NonD family hydrolase n=1 Tax=Marinobacter sp. TaxID=50741 RepID=UPI00299D2A27|nr:CocE/NonD family hydrolase [Marinobacter sp.]MDX1755704.1 CocE/NonD family hydrolase [Marinobacter sp.]